MFEELFFSLVFYIFCLFLDVKFILHLFRYITWFSVGSSTNPADRHDITEILLKVALNTINQTKPLLQ
jgi:hypothetical protein